MTYFIPFNSETDFFAQARGFPQASILRRRPAVVRMPVIKMPRSIKRRYSDSELSSAARMLEKLRRSTDAAPRGDLDADKVLDVVVEKLIDQLE